MAQLYAIPKNEDWGHNLNNIRPIALLETFRKCVTKIFTSRLSKIFKENIVLKGYNFVGLPGCSTEAPIHILNSIIEEAAEKKKELWILLQDMQKAFDSVSLVMLERALLCLKLPVTSINFILDLFGERQIKIITALGLSTGFKAIDGIDQGEVISPLVWRIFYDLLLFYVQSETDLGYDLSLAKYEVYPNNYLTRCVAIAYTDDTTWVASNKQ